MGQEVRVLTYTSVREDAIQLYGFLTQQYYDLFALLLSVSGIGPKVAIGILGAARPEDFYLAVQSRDLKMLTKLPGIGKKTAERNLPPQSAVKANRKQSTKLWLHWLR